MPLGLSFLQKLRPHRSPRKTPPKSYPLPRFKHQPLRPRDTGVLQIRLLILDPGIGYDIVRCRLEHVDLDKSVEYEALSYVWGDPDDTSPIVVGNDTLEVTENLFLALLNVRLPTEPRTLWVDAICIDQSNTAEKGHQVQFMSEIYKKASQVIAFLGDGDDVSDRAFEIFSNLGTIIEPITRALGAQHFDRVQLKRVVDSMTTEEFLTSTTRIIEELQNLSSEDRTALRSTFQDREYWQRVWIVQEVVLADHLTIYCGAWSLPWPCIDRFLTLVPHMYERLIYELDHLRLLSKVRGLTDGEQSATAIQSLLTKCKCLDQRDYVFATIGLSVFKTIYPDYTKTVSEVFLEATREIIRRKKHLCSVFLLRGVKSNAPEFCGRQYGTSSSERVTKFEASWTIDWSATFFWSGFHTLCAKAKPMRELAMKSALSFSDSRILHLKGMRHNTLTFVSLGFHFPDSTRYRSQRLVQKIMLSVHKHIGTITIEKVIQALFQDRYRCRTKSEYRPLGVIELKILKLLYLEWLGLEGMAPNEKEDALDLQARHKELSGRSFEDILVTKNLSHSTFFFNGIDSVGIVFGNAQPGDELWNIHGTVAPVILRPKQDPSIQSQLGVYEFVGAVWIAGMMGGEVWDAIDAYQESLARANSSENGLGESSDYELKNGSRSEIKTSAESEAADNSNNPEDSTQTYFGFLKEEIEQWVEEEFLLN